MASTVTTTSKPATAPKVSTPPETKADIPHGASYSQYLGSLVTKLHREVALPQLIADCAKAIVASRNGWNLMVVSFAANLTLNGMPNTVTQLQLIGLQLSMIPLFVLVTRSLVVLTPERHIAVDVAPPGTKPTTREYIDMMMKKVPNKQDADRWLEEIHLTRDHPVLLKLVRARDAKAHDEMWSLDKQQSYIPTIVFWSLKLLYIWINFSIIKKKFALSRVSVEHIGTVIHVFVDSSVAGLWHHVNTGSELDDEGTVAAYLGFAPLFVVSSPPSLMVLFCSGFKTSQLYIGLALFVFFLGLGMAGTNHHFQHGRSKQPLPKLIRKYVFKGFLWKYGFLLDDQFHKSHHFYDPETNFALTAGFMDKLVEKLKHGHKLYIHNPKLNHKVWLLYFASINFFVMLCNHVTVDS